MTGDRSTLYTVPEVQAILDEDRSKAFLVALICCVLCAAGGFLSGVYFVTNLYGGH